MDKQNLLNHYYESTIFICVPRRILKKTTVPCVELQFSSKSRTDLE